METLVKERGGREIGKLNGLTWWEIRADVSEDLINNKPGTAVEPRN